MLNKYKVYVIRVQDIDSFRKEVEKYNELYETYTPSKGNIQTYYSFRRNKWCFQEPLESLTTQKFWNPRKDKLKHILNENYRKQ